MQNCWRKFQACFAAVVFVASGAYAQAQYGDVRGAAAKVAADEKPAAADESATASVLHLKDGDYFRGHLADTAKRNVVAWLADGAVQPFDFGLEALQSAVFAGVGTTSPSGEFCIELTEGDLLYGSMKQLTADHLVVESGRFGELKIARSEVRQITSMQPTAFRYRGPNGMAGWTPEGKSKWREEAGRIVTGNEDASIHADIPIPKKAHFEFELSWTKKPQFTLTVCSNKNSDRPDDGFRLEVWEQKLVLVRETQDKADVVLLMDLGPNQKRVHLEANYDFEAGLFTVLSLDGKQLGSVQLARPNATALGCIRLINNGADVCLEQLDVSQWDGQAPSQVEADKQRIHKTDGTIIYGEIVGYTPEKKQFQLRDKNAEGSTIAVADVSSIVLMPQSSDKTSATRLGLDDGSRVSGDLAKLADSQLFLERRGIDRPLACPVANIRSLSSLKVSPVAPPSEKSRVGRWESDGIRSRGTLQAAAVSSDPKATCLVWKPWLSDTASAGLRSDASGGIIYKDPPAPPVAMPVQQQVRRVRVIRRAGGVETVTSGNPPVRQMISSDGTANLCLVTGDRIPCKSVEIDEQGVRFESQVITSHFVPHRLIKALEFVPNWTAVALAEEKKLRLLTLPRMQKENPPTHLIVSISGDFLRGRLNAMDKDTASVEARLDAKLLPRKQIACIIWLHKEPSKEEGKEGEDANAAPPAPPAASVMQAQAIQSTGVRLTFTPKECSGDQIIGVSESLGECTVPIKSVDQLYFGKSLKAVVEKLPYNVWQLTDAPDPQFAQEGDGSNAGNSGGSQSAFVGKPAPDFELELAAGEKFKLSGVKGSVVVLDFWASWCGPCMQAMPQTDKIIEQFKNQKVKLVAVNMQEDKATIEGALERLKINPAVAMDIDGAIAERYQVSAIPQIVVINAESTVVDLIIGAGPNYEAQLTKAIEKALAPPTPAAQP